MNQPKLKPRTQSPLKLLLPYQTRWVDDNARFKIGVQARQTGKSFQTACEATTDALIDPGTRWTCLSSGERQAIEWIDKCKEWAEAYKLAISSYSEMPEMGEAENRVAEIRFANGSRIVAIPANPSTARGYSTNIILDEFAYHEDPDAIFVAMFPSLSNPLAGTFRRRFEALYTGKDVLGIQRKMKIRIVSTFNGRDNKFFQLWDNKKKNGYSGHMTTIHDAIKDGLPIDIEELRSGLDDAEAFAQEYECSPTDTSNVLLPYSLIALAESDEATEAIEHEYFNNRRELFCGIDFGRHSDPTVCWTLELIGDILWTREVLMLHKTNVREQNEILAGRIKGARRTTLDYTGPGVGFGDHAIKDEGIGEYKPEDHKFGKIELFTFSPRTKRLLFPTLRRKFESPTKVRIPKSRAIREDLHAMQQVIKAGEFTYWAPRTREGHSDRCTALALAIRAAGESTAGAIRDPKIIHFGQPAWSRLPSFKPMRLAR